MADPNDGDLVCRHCGKDLATEDDRFGMTIPTWTLLRWDTETQRNVLMGVFCSPEHVAAQIDGSECTNCGMPIHWSLDFRRWVHDQGNVRYCVANFTAENNPTTEAEPAQGVQDG